MPSVACTEPHDGEVYHFGESNPDRDLDYPGDDAAQQQAALACIGEPFAGYVGTAYDASELEIFTIYTQEARWDKDRGEFICIAFATDGATLTESVRGSGR